MDHKLSKRLAIGCLFALFSLPAWGADGPLKTLLGACYSVVTGKPLPGAAPESLSNATQADLDSKQPIPEINFRVRGASPTILSRVYHLEIGQAVIFKLRNTNKYQKGFVTDVSFEWIEINGQSFRQYELDELSRLPGARPATDSVRVTFLNERKNFLRQAERENQVWSELQNTIAKDMEKLRTLEPREKYAAMLARGKEALEKIKARYGVDEIAFHFNRTGAAPTEYVEHDGLVLTKSMDYNPKDVVFALRHADNLFEVLNTDYEGGRMGDTLIVFSPSSPYFQDGIKKGMIVDPEHNSFEFKKDWVKQQPFGRPRNVSGFGEITYTAIPTTEFLVPPIRVYPDFIYGKFNRTEESYVNMLYVEYVLLNSGRRRD